MKTLLTLLCTCLVSLGAAAQNFSQWFDNQTLRVDYTFAGDSATQQIYLDALTRTDHWADAATTWTASA